MSLVKNGQVVETPKDPLQHIDTTKGAVPIRASQQDTVAPSLEEEIYFLRSKMEQAVWQEHSLTSDLVVQLSSRLDSKINEYMRLKLKKGVE